MLVIVVIKRRIVEHGATLVHNGLLQLGLRHFRVALVLARLSTFLAVVSVVQLRLAWPRRRISSAHGSGRFGSSCAEVARVDLMWHWPRFGQMVFVRVKVVASMKAVRALAVAIDLFSLLQQGHVLKLFEIFEWRH